MKDIAEHEKNVLVKSIIKNGLFLNRCGKIGKNPNSETFQIPKFSMKRTSILKTKNHTRIKKCANLF